MQILPVKCFSAHVVTKNTNVPQKENNLFSEKSVTKNPVYPKYLSCISFYGSSISVKNPQELAKFEKSGEHYLDYIKKMDGTPQEVASLLMDFVNSPKHRDSFIEDLTREPNKSKEVVSVLVDKLGGKENFLRWYLADNGYVKNYDRYLKDKVENATSISELVKLQPNWGYWTLERKYCALHGYLTKETQDKKMRDMEANFTFGELPRDFADQTDFRYLVERLKSAAWMFNGTLSIYGSNYKVEQLEGGDLSSKNIYKVSRGGKDYIIKMDRFYPEEHVVSSNPYNKRNMREGRLLRGDSVYLDACIDYYLQQNGCNSNAKLLYYDFKNNVSLYEYVDATEIKDSRTLGMVGQVEANKLFKDINDLGVYLNDIGLSFNCYRDKNGKLKLVDVGHGEYVDLLKPGGNLLTIESSNLCGFSLKNAVAGLNIGLLGNLNQTYTAPQAKIPQSAPIFPQARLSAPAISTGGETKSSLNLPDVSGVDRDAYIQSELAKDEYSYTQLCIFADQKNKIKRDLKWEISDLESKNEEMYCDPAEQVIEIEKRFELLEYYKKSLLARYRNIMSNDPEVIHGILKAMKREMKNIYTRTSENNCPLDNQDKMKMDGYKYFYSVFKLGDK